MNSCRLSHSQRDMSQFFSVTCHTFWRECSCSVVEQLHSRVVFWRIRGGPPAPSPAEPAPPPGRPPPLGCGVFWRIRGGPPGAVAGSAVRSRRVLEDLLLFRDE